MLARNVAILIEWQSARRRRLDCGNAWGRNLPRIDGGKIGKKTPVAWARPPGWAWAMQFHGRRIAFIIIQFLARRCNSLNRPCRRP